MENSLAVAKYLYSLNYEAFKTPMDEMKMHQLMYFAQRESLIINNNPLFTESFYGWKFGPVLKSVRSEYMTAKPFSNASDLLCNETKHILDEVFIRYGNLSSWKLSNLSRCEFSWKATRKGLVADENGDRKITLNSIRIDAVSEASRRR